MAMATSRTFLDPCPPRYTSIPPNTPHSIVFSLPQWQDNVDFALGKKELFDSLKTTYPRFVIHPFVRQLVEIVLEESNIQPNHPHCFLFPSLKAVEECRSFLHLHFPSSTPQNEVRCVTEIANPPPNQQIYALFLPEEQREKAMKFWIFAGNGISTRLAEHCLLRRQGAAASSTLPLSLFESDDHVFAEYYKSRPPLSSVTEAKEAIRLRFAGITKDGGNIRGVRGVSVDDTYLFPNGMSAIWNANKMLVNTVGRGGSEGLEGLKPAHVNILYIDSYKFLTPPNSGYHLFQNHTLDDLEHLLSSKGTPDPDHPPVLGILTDFPGNPHLRCADLPRLRSLADRFHIPLVIDETVGGLLNVKVLPYADVVVASLTKSFSGFANVLGGAMLLNPTSRFYTKFKAHMEDTYYDTYYDTDALVMEINSRGMFERTAIINYNTEKLADMLYTRSRSTINSAQNTSTPSIIKEIFHPKYNNLSNYTKCLNTSASSAGLTLETVPGYSGLVTVVFTSVGAAKVFYDALRCYKGATLGTVFTLAMAFTAIAFRPGEEMRWVGENGVDEALVRFSVGTEDCDKILNSVSEALEVAEQWVKGKAHASGDDGDCL